MIEVAEGVEVAMVRVSPDARPHGTRRIPAAFGFRVRDPSHDESDDWSSHAASPNVATRTRPRPVLTSGPLAVTMSRAGRWRLATAAKYHNATPGGGQSADDAVTGPRTNSRRAVRNLP